MLRIDGKDIAADGLGLFWFVEVAIEFDFSESLRDSGLEIDFNW